MLSMVFVGFLIVLNFAISVFNAWSVGKAWFETKAIGGWPRFMAWMGAVMSACGFTWAYLVLIGIVASALGWLDQEYLNAMFSLGYLAIIIPVLGSGLAIMVNSWVIAWKKRSITNMGIAGWNTFAQAYNTYNAISAIPDSLKSVLGVFGNSKSGGKDSAKAKLVLILVIVSILGGILTAIAIIRITARGQAEKVRREFVNLK